MKKLLVTIAALVSITSSHRPRYPTLDQIEAAIASPHVEPDVRNKFIELREGMLKTSSEIPSETTTGAALVPTSWTWNQVLFAAEDKATNEELRPYLLDVINVIMLEAFTGTGENFNKDNIKVNIPEHLLHLVPASNEILTGEKVHTMVPLKSKLNKNKF